MSVCLCFRESTASYTSNRCVDYEFFSGPIRAFQPITDVPRPQSDGVGRGLLAMSHLLSVVRCFNILFSNGEFEL